MPGKPAETGCPEKGRGHTASGCGEKRKHIHALDRIAEESVLTIFVGQAAERENGRTIRRTKEKTRYWQRNRNGFFIRRFAGKPKRKNGSRKQAPFPIGASGENRGGEIFSRQAAPGRACEEAGPATRSKCPGSGGGRRKIPGDRRKGREACARFGEQPAAARIKQENSEMLRL